MENKIKWAKGFFVGIDYGTTKSSIATVESNEAPGLQNIDPSYSDSGIPSAVKLSLISERGVENLSKFQIDHVGWFAKYTSLSPNDDTTHVFEQAKLRIGKEILASKDFTPQHFDSVTPEDIATIVIRFLKQAIEKTQSIANNNVEQKLRSATITVPANWNPIQREATKYAAMVAGFDDIELIDEPVAALLHVWKNTRIQLGLGKKDEQIMVIDFGGGTCDIAVVKLRRPSVISFRKKENVQLVLSTGNNNLGGELINKMIEELFIAERPKDATKMTIGQRKKHIENLKIQLNDFMREQAIAYVSEAKNLGLLNIKKWKGCFPKRFDKSSTLGSTSWKLSAGRLHKILSDQRRAEISKGKKSRSVIQAFIDLIEYALTECGGSSKIDRVILVGGSSYLYFVIPILRAMFSTLTWGVTLFQPDSPEKCVALGAALHERDRHNKNRRFEPKLFYDVSIPTSVQPIELIKANKRLPIAYHQATTVPFKVDEEARELTIRILGKGRESKVEDLDVTKTLKPVGGKIIPNSDVYRAYAKVSVDGVISLKVIEKKGRIRLTPIDEYPLSKDLVEKARQEFEKKFIESIDQ